MLTLLGWPGATDGHGRAVVGISRCSKNRSILGFSLLNSMFGGMTPFCRACEEAIKLAKPAAPSVWPMTVLTDPTSSFSLEGDGLPSGKSAVAMASASCVFERLMSARGTRRESQQGTGQYSHHRPTYQCRAHGNIVHGLVAW